MLEQGKSTTTLSVNKLNCERMKWPMRHPFAAVVDLKPIDLQISLIVFNPRIIKDS